MILTIFLFAFLKYVTACNVIFFIGHKLFQIWWLLKEPFVLQHHWQNHSSNLRGSNFPSLRMFAMTGKCLLNLFRHAASNSLTDPPCRSWMTRSCSRASTSFNSATATKSLTVLLGQLASLKALAMLHPFSVMILST